MQNELFDNSIRDSLERIRRDLLGDEWFEKLKTEFDEPYMQSLSKKLTIRRGEVMVYPSPDRVFRAYQMTPYDKVKVILLLQDPYNDGTATGLAMGVENPKIYPKSIDYLDKAIEEDVYEGMRFPPLDPDLEYLTREGVMLLNTALTVEHRAPNSHQGWGWHNFIKATIEALNKRDYVVWIMMGSNAQALTKYISDAHDVIEVEHPNKHTYDKRPGWDYQRCFSKCNQLLINNSKTPVVW